MIKRLMAVLLCLVFTSGVFEEVSAASMGVGAAEPAESEKIAEEVADAVADVRRGDLDHRGADQTGLEARYLGVRQEARERTPIDLLPAGTYRGDNSAGVD